MAHCSWSPTYTADFEAYIDKFLLDKKEAKTTFLRSPKFEGKFSDEEMKKWIPWTTPTLK